MSVKLSQTSSPLHHIRTIIFAVDKQREFGAIIGISQAVISLVESGRRPLSRELMERIRAAAFDRGIPWNDAWFFQVPSDPKAPRRRRTLKASMSA
jgi:transcriptional regulator with XRE-family HTH domain